MLEGIEKETGVERVEKGHSDWEMLGSTLPDYSAVLGRSLTPAGPQFPFVKWK